LGCLDITSDSVVIVVKNALGGECLRDTVSQAGALAVNEDSTSFLSPFAVGFYTIDYTILNDATKTKSATITVQAPNLVCNDEINIPFGSACAITVTPDMILEDPCDTIANDTMQYQINIILGSDVGDTIFGTPYPTLTSAQILDAGLNLCTENNTAKVEIIRTFGDVWAETGICDNGDKSAPIFIDQAGGRDTLVLCEVSEDALKAMVTAPTAIDNCVEMPDVAISVEGDLDFSNMCFEPREFIIRYTAEDLCGNKNATVADTKY